MEKAIKRAIKGGYFKGKKPHVEKHDVGHWLWYTKGRHTSFLTPSEMLLDPLFWEALAKAEKWKDFEEFTCGCKDVKKMAGVRRTYINRQHDLIDHIVARKTIDSFFVELLK